MHACSGMYTVSVLLCDIRLDGLAGAVTTFSTWIEHVPTRLMLVDVALGAALLIALGTSLAATDPALAPNPLARATARVPWQGRPAALLISLVFVGPAFALGAYMLFHFPRRDFAPAPLASPHPKLEVALAVLILACTALPYGLGWGWVFHHGHFSMTDLLVEAEGQPHAEGALILALAAATVGFAWSNGGPKMWLVPIIVAMYSTPVAALAAGCILEARSWRGRGVWFGGACMNRVLMLEETKEAKRHAEEEEAREKVVAMGRELV